MPVRYTVAHDAVESDRNRVAVNGARWYTAPRARQRRAGTASFPRRDYPIGSPRLTVLNGTSVTALTGMAAAVTGMPRTAPPH